MEPLSFEDGCRMLDDSLLECSLPSADVSQSDSPNNRCWCLQKSADDLTRHLERDNADLRSLLEKLMAEMNHRMVEIEWQRMEIECLREQRALLLEGPLHKFSDRQREIKDGLGEKLETIREHEPLRMLVINGKFRFEEMRKWKRYGEKDRKASIRRYHM